MFKTRFSFALEISSVSNAAVVAATYPLRYLLLSTIAGRGSVAEKHRDRSGPPVSTNQRSGKVLGCHVGGISDRRRRFTAVDLPGRDRNCPYARVRCRNDRDVSRRGRLPSLAGSSSIPTVSNNGSQAFFSLVRPIMAFAFFSLLDRSSWIPLRPALPSYHPHSRT